MSPLAARPLRPVRDAEIEQFQRDGVVCLRETLPVDWLRSLDAAVEVALGMPQTTTDMTAMAHAIEGSSPEPGVGRFLSGVDHWRHQEAFRRFACESPLPELVAQLLRSEAVYLYEDSLLVKQAGAREATHFHQDSGYFHLRGEKLCTTWSPLDPVTRETGAVEYVRGSHRWGREYRPNLFIDDRPIPDTEGETLSGAPEGSELLSFDTRPGDVIVHHARTVHGAGPNRSADRARRAISVRYAGDDATHWLRPGAPLKPHHAALRNGDALGGDACPLVWGGTRRHPR